MKTMMEEGRKLEVTLQHHSSLTNEDTPKRISRMPVESGRYTGVVNSQGIPHGQVRFLGQMQVVGLNGHNIDFSSTTAPSTDLLQ